MHRHHGKVKLGINPALRDATAENRFKPLQIQIGEAELYPDDNREDATGQRPEHSCKQVLTRNGLVIGTENVFADKS